MVVFNMGARILEYGPEYYGFGRGHAKGGRPGPGRTPLPSCPTLQQHSSTSQAQRVAVRTTLNIDEDVLVAVKELARRESKSAGSVVSDLLRASLGAASAPYPVESREQTEEQFGSRPFSTRGGIVTNALIDRLREGAGD